MSRCAVNIGNSFNAQFMTEKGESEHTMTLMRIKHVHGGLINAKVYKL